MEILWPTLGICVLVCFVFFVLVQHWQRVLRHQTWTIRRLNERVRNLEEVDDPEFRRRLGESVPSPLEQVFTFSFRLSDQFWRETLHATQETSSFIQAFGSFLGSVKIERWRGHSVATITEVLPDRRSAVWQTRSLDCFFDKESDSDKLTLWELPLARMENSNQRPPSLELVLKEKSVELCADGSEPQLNHAAWRAFYSHRDELAGFEWQLWVRDLNKKGEWDRWRILEPAVDPVTQNSPQRRN